MIYLGFAWLVVLLLACRVLVSKAGHWPRNAGTLLLYLAIPPLAWLAVLDCLLTFGGKHREMRVLSYCVTGYLLVAFTGVLGTSIRLSSGFEQMAMIGGYWFVVPFSLLLSAWYRSRE